MQTPLAAVGSTAYLSTTLLCTSVTDELTCDGGRDPPADADRPMLSPTWPVAMGYLNDRSATDLAPGSTLRCVTKKTADGSGALASSDAHALIVVFSKETWRLLPMEPSIFFLVAGVVVLLFGCVYCAEWDCSSRKKSVTA
jgi:hypothetical protein